MRPAARISVHVVLPLLAGALVYVAWRDPSLLGWRWAEALGVADPARALRETLRATEIALPEWVRFTLPDALWVYALTYALGAVNAESARRERAIAMLAPALMGPGAELAQWAGVLPGTFDGLDLLATVTAMIAAVATSGGGVRPRRVPAVAERARAEWKTA